MEVYVVTYRESYPGANEVPEDDLVKVAFVLAGSFKEAEDKVLKRFKTEYERVYIKAISVDEKATIIV